MIQVRSGDIEQALLSFRRECVQAGIHAALKRRERYPNLSDRRKAKESVARQRRIKTELKKERQREEMENFRMMRQQRPLRGRGRA
jgi:ribosomal protein S21